MRKYVFGISLIACTVCFLISCDSDHMTTSELNFENDDLSERGRNPSVSGHVEIDSVDGHSQQYSFTAVMHKDGTIKGEFQLFDTYNDSTRLIAHGDVECFSIADDGKTAWLGGVIERGSVDTMNFVGAEAYWTVVDNGQGAHADPDEATEIVYSLDGVLAQDHCTDGAGTFVYSGPIIRSNVKVKPN